jgi:hypothetical protein
MQTGPDDSAVYPDLARAANEDFMPIGAKVSGGSSTPLSGWSAFEVWHSRIKGPYDARHPSADRLCTWIIPSG